MFFVSQKASHGHQGAVNGVCHDNAARIGVGMDAVAVIPRAVGIGEGIGRGVVVG